MSKVLLAGLLAVSSLSFAASGTPKAKAKATCTTTATCTPTATCKPGCPPSPNCPQACR